MRITYEQALKDHQALWAIGPAADMTGGYVDQKDLDKLLNSPTKATARHCLLCQIDYWFQTGTEEQHDVEKLIIENPNIREIAERHGYA